MTDYEYAVFVEAMETAPEGFFDVNLEDLFFSVDEFGR